MCSRVMLAAALLCSSLCAMGDGIPGTKSDEPITWENVVLTANGEWARVTDGHTIFLSVPSQTNIFTVAFDVDVPNATGTIFGFASSGGGEIRVRREAGGALACYTGTDDMPGAIGGNAAVVSSGFHRIVVEYHYTVHSVPGYIRGTTVYLDGAKVFHSAGLVWGPSSKISYMAIGGAAIKIPMTDVIGNLHVRNLRFWDGLRPGTYFLVY